MRVDFVAPLRPVFVYPQPPVRAQRGALGIAVAQAPDLGQRAAAADERVVRRHPAVFGDADHLAVVVVQLLGVGGPKVPFAQRQEQRAVGAAVDPVFHDPAAEMQPAGHLGPLAEKYPHLVQPGAVRRQPAPRQRRAVAGTAVGGRLGITPVERAVVGKGAVGHDVEQPTLPAGGHRRQPGQWGGQRSVRADQPHAARPLGDHHAGARQKRQCPGVFQPLRHGHGPHGRRDQRLCAPGAAALGRRRTGNPGRERYTKRSNKRPFYAGYGHKTHKKLRQTGVSGHCGAGSRQSSHFCRNRASPRLGSSA
jgi:hypothetical protein